MTQIKIRQNEDAALDVQYAARYYYNRAEIFNFLAWLFCMLSLLSVLIPHTASSAVVYGIPVIVDIVFALISMCFNKYVELGANIRAAFDDYVLGFTDKITMSQKLREYVLKAVEKNPIQAEIHKRNTGKDIPPGVRDWYNTNSEKDGIDAVFVCQKENVWWEKKMIVRKILFYVCMVIFCILFFIILKWAGHVSVWQMVLSSALLIRTVERICENFRYFRIENKIDGQIELLEVQKTKEQVVQLQSTINEKRKLKIVGINFLHAFCAQKLSVIYEKTKA